MKPWLVEFSFARKLKEASAGRQPWSEGRSRSGISITFDSAGFALTDQRIRGGECRRMAWTEVAKVVAFKRDLFACDIICLFLEDAEGDGLEIHEEMDGWLALCEALPRFLKGCRPFDAWFWEVAHPAFAANQTEIFRRTPTVVVAAPRFPDE